MGLFAMDQNPLKEDEENLAEHRWMLVNEKMEVKHSIPLWRTGSQFCISDCSAQKTYVVFA